MTLVYQFLSGAVMLAFWAIGVFFLKFWKKTRDRLFFYFATAFWMLAIERIALAILRDPTQEIHSFVYLIRLTAFSIILFAIADKNRVERKQSSKKL